MMVSFAKFSPKVYHEIAIKLSIHTTSVFWLIRPQFGVRWNKRITRLDTGDGLASAKIHDDPWKLLAIRAPIRRSRANSTRLSPSVWKLIFDDKRLARGPRGRTSNLTIRHKRSFFQNKLHRYTIFDWVQCWLHRPRHANHTGNLVHVPATRLLTSHSTKTFEPKALTKYLLIRLALINALILDVRYMW